MTSLLQGASYRLGPQNCATGRCTTALVEPIVDVVTHADCTCNEERALRGRHLVDTGARVGSLCSVKDVLRSLASDLRLSNNGRESAQHYIENYSGDKRKLLQEARISLEGKAICPADAAVRMFLKDDKYGATDYKEPRCIQYRSKRFHLYVGRFLHPIEKQVMEATEGGVRFCAKSRNSLERASDLLEMWESYADPVAVLLDHSKFDAHITTEHLKVEHEFYHQVNPDPRLKKVLKWQIRNKGYTKNGTSYTVEGTRMSGDVNTGLGNSVLNYGMLRAWLMVCGVRGHIYVDGDDSVVVMSASDEHKLKYEFWVQMGMETKHDMAYEFEHVEFCQCRPVYIAEQRCWRMVRNPVRLVTRAPWTTKKYNDKGYDRLTRTIGWCELAANGGVPVLQAYASWLMGQGSGRIMKHEVRAHLRDRVEHVSLSKPGTATRLSFFNAWGISPQQQIRIEESSDWRAVVCSAY